MESVTKGIVLTLAVLLPLVSEIKADCQLQGLTRGKIFCTSLRSLPSTYPDENATHLEFSTGNVIKNITADSFATLRKLKSLKLSRVGVENIAADAFQGLAELETLSLGENSINEIKPGTFTALQKLKALRLESNSLSSLPTDALPASLESLELDYNKFKEVPFDAIKGKTRLNTLKMNNNLISSLPDFFNIKTLKNLEVTDNQLTTVNPDIFKGLQLKEILLNSNPFVCDCNLTAFFQWIKGYQFAGGNAFKPEFSEYECQGPKLLAARAFSTFNLTAFEEQNCTIQAVAAKTADEEQDTTPRGTASVTTLSNFLSAILVLVSALWKMDEW